MIANNYVTVHPRDTFVHVPMLVSVRVHTRISFTFQNMTNQKYNGLLNFNINVPISFISLGPNFFLLKRY